MQSKAKTVAGYLSELPADRRAAVAAVRKVVLQNLDKKFEEGMQYGVIGYYVPHRLYPPGYHCDPKQPLPFAGLASQKNYISLYLSCIYGDHDESRWFQQAWAKTGKKLNMGKCCVRFTKVEDLALDVIAEAFRRSTVEKFIEDYETTLKSLREKGPSRTSKATTVRRKKSATPKKLAGSARPRRKKARQAS